MKNISVSLKKIKDVYFGDCPCDNCLFNSNCPESGCPHNFPKSFSFPDLTIPHYVLFNCELNSNEKILLSFIISLSVLVDGIGFCCYSTNQYLAGIMSISEPTISKGINKLMEEGFLTKKTIQNYDGSLRRFLFVNYKKVEDGVNE